MGVTLSKKRVIHGCLDIQHVLVPGVASRTDRRAARRAALNEANRSLTGWTSPLEWGPPAADWTAPQRNDLKAPIGDGNACEQCLVARGSIASFASVDSVHVASDSAAGSPEHTRTADDWNAPECAACSPAAATRADVQVHVSRGDDEDAAAKHDAPDDDDAETLAAPWPVCRPRTVGRSPTAAQR